MSWWNRPKKPDAELEEFRAIMTVPTHFEDGFSLSSLLGTLFLALVMVPGALPSIFTGLRIGMGIAWMTLIAAELVGVKNGYGLGYMIMAARDFARNDLLVAGIVVIGLVGFLVDWLIRLAERRLLRWR